MSGLEIVTTFFVTAESALPSTLLTEHMQPGTAENIIIAVVSRLRYQAAPEVMLLILELMSK